MPDVTDFGQWPVPPVPLSPQDGPPRRRQRRRRGLIFYWVTVGLLVAAAVMGLLAPTTLLHDPAPFDTAFQ